MTPNAGDIVAQENQFNDPPEAGRQFFMVAVEMTYQGPDSAVPTEVDLEAVGSSNIVYRWSHNTCGVFPNPYQRGNRAFTNGTIAGNVCWSVKTEDAASLVMIARGRFREEGGLYFSLR